MRKFLIPQLLYIAYQRPSKSSLIAGTFDKGEIVEIEEECQGWGRLPNNQGWLPLWDLKEIID